MNWRYFAVSAFLVTMLLSSVGAPLFAIAAGIVCTLAVDLWKKRMD